MTMISFTYDDGDSIATVTYTPEYGFMAAGDRAIIERITYKAVEPRTVEVPVLDVPMRADVPITPPEDVPMKLGCAACGCLKSAHNTSEGKCSRHQCSAWVQDF